MIKTAREAQALSKKVQDQKNEVHENQQYNAIMEQIEAQARIGYSSLTIGIRLSDGIANKLTNAGFNIKLGPYNMPGYAYQDIAFNNTFIS